MPPCAFWCLIVIQCLFLYSLAVVFKATVMWIVFTEMILTTFSWLLMLCQILNEGHFATANVFPSLAPIFKAKWYMDRKWKTLSMSCWNYPKHEQNLRNLLGFGWKRINFRSTVVFLSSSPSYVVGYSFTSFCSCTNPLAFFFIKTPLTPILLPLSKILPAKENTGEKMRGRKERRANSLRGKGPIKRAPFASTECAQRLRKMKEVKKIRF